MKNDADADSREDDLVALADLQFKAMSSQAEKPKVGARRGDRILLLADMHLKPLDARTPEAARLAVADNERLARFLDEMGDGASMLVLLGDAFEFWLERRGKVVGDYLAALSLFKLASERGLQIHHVSGNRDFVVGEGLGLDPTTRFPGFLRLKRGFTVSRLCDFGIEPHGPRFRTHQAGRTIAFLHGDAMCGKERKFMLLRGLLQGRLGRMFWRRAPWSFLQAVASRIQGRPRRRRKPVNPGASLSQEAVKREVAMGGDLVLCGHFHAPYSQDVEVAGRHGRLEALPAWMDGWYGVIENGEYYVDRFE